ncbi:MaoC/PaaZ C-terminal domain-containing protein [Ureibacillus sp. FSL K6-8385]|uniref:MaoC family dehydratase n=1 Tax=Ureibacillus TaxID=160795 RepID=UPI0015EE4EB2|nr:MaoC/PaaZ C-terminal domain-containing protein [Ureibacillus terrenus]MED3662016.1 MaoC/PaaZ C-terminal domain-containing protein [Ureibacillus terrenus]MED3764705.1 MaoC/PaaZ C-terminal domain-containing protein [Ureibacillus terrenus]
MKTIRFKVTEQDIESYAELSGDVNPIHLNPEYAKAHGFSGKVAHGMLTMAKVWGILANEFDNMQFPAVFRLHFQSPVYVGETVELTIEEEDCSITITGKVVKGKASL